MKPTNRASIKNDITTWLENAGRYPVLSQERMMMIARQIQSLPTDSPKRRKLVNTLVQHNLRLVIKCVNSFMANSCHNKWGCPETVDYLQVGTIGLIRAAELFDPTKGYTFSTYANNWIRSKVARYNLNNKSMVSISESMARKLIYYRRNGYLKSKSTNKLLDETAILPMLREVENAMQCSSLNSKSKYGTEGIDFLIDQKTQEKEDTVEDINLFEKIHKALDDAGVTPMGKEVLISFFIYNSSYSEIANNLSVKVHRVRKEKEDALAKARSSPAFRVLV